MEKISRDEMKIIFGKVKNLRIPGFLEEVDFTNLTYFSWIDLTDYVLYMVYEYGGQLEGILWKINRPVSKPLALGFCDICHKHRKKAEIISIYTQTRKLEKGISYHSWGFMICEDYLQCNRDIKDTKSLDKIYKVILAT